MKEFTVEPLPIAVVSRQLRWPTRSARPVFVETYFGANTTLERTRVANLRWAGIVAYVSLLIAPVSPIALRDVGSGYVGIAGGVACLIAAWTLLVRSRAIFEPGRVVLTSRALSPASMDEQSEADQSAASSIGQHLETFRFAAGETVLAPGDPVDRLYIISDGEATVYRTDENGQEIEIATLRKGQYVGEIGLLVPNAPHTKTVRATTNLTVLAMDESTFRHLMQTTRITAEETVQRTGDRAQNPQPS